MLQRVALITLLLLARSTLFGAQTNEETYSSWHRDYAAKFTIQEKIRMAAYLYYSIVAIDKASLNDTAWNDLLDAWWSPSVWRSYNTASNAAQAASSAISDIEKSNSRGVSNAIWIAQNAAHAAREQAAQNAYRSDKKVGVQKAARAAYRNVFVEFYTRFVYPDGKLLDTLPITISEGPDKARSWPIPDEVKLSLVK